MTGCLALLIKKYIIYISNRNRIQQIHNSLVICGSQEDEENNNNNNVIVSPSPPNVESYAISLLDYYEVVILFVSPQAGHEDLAVAFDSTFQT